MVYWLPGRHVCKINYLITGIFLPFRTWGLGPLTMGKNSAQISISNWENLIESLKQFEIFLPSSYLLNNLFLHFLL